MRVIEEATKDLPLDTPEKEVRKILRDAYPFGQRKMHPYEMWLKEVKRFLDKRFSGVREYRPEEGFFKPLTQGDPHEPR